MTLDNMMNLFSPAVRKLPRFSSLAEAVLQQVADLQGVIPEMEAVFSLATATGVQLDLLGDTLGLERDSRSDAEYRELIRSKLALWRWNGTNETVPAVLAEAFPEQDVSLADNGDCSVTVNETIGSDLLPVPAGVSLRVAVA